MDFEVVNSFTFFYGRDHTQCDLLLDMTKEQRENVQKETKNLWEGSEVFVRISDYWCPMVSEDEYEDVWSGEIKPILGAPIGCYGIVRGTHKPRDRKQKLDALYEEFTKNAPPHPKDKLFGDSIKKAIFGPTL
jgi:hypothetical protein